MAEDKKTIEPDLVQADEPVTQAAPPPAKTAGKSAWWQRFTNWYGDRKKWSIPVTVLVIILIVAAIPFTRYALSGLVVKRDLNVKVLDSSTGTPISGVDVSLGSLTAQTDSNGYASLHHVRVGRHNLTLSKKYYQDRTFSVLTPIFSQKSLPSARLVATGRQIKITVKNLINQKVLKNVSIKIAGTSAVTDQTGSALVVVPADASAEKASLSLAGFNDADVTAKVSNDKIQDNQFNLTPSGKVYFLSKLSGKIDVVKTNLDGTDRQTVLAGTGKEDDQNTVLLASRDWKYLALLSARAGGTNPALYLIDTSNDTLTTIDEGDINIQLIGWSDNYFVYEVGRNNVQPWQSKAASLKSYNAQTKQLTILDSTNATGTSPADANYETYGVSPIALDNEIVYTKTWYQYPGYLQVTGQSNTLNIVKPNNTGKKVIKSLDAGQSYFGSLVFHSPDSVYVQVSNLDGSPSAFYEFNGVGLTQKNNLTDNDIFKTYPTYLYSPGGDQTFWSEPRDGKSTLFIGDEQGASGKQIATLSDYSPYGWYSDNYLLVSKNASELYIMPADGSQSPVKISDYHKPQVSFPGYGGGYGGL